MDARTFSQWFRAEARHRGCFITGLSEFAEIAMPAEAVAKTARPGHPVAHKRLAPVVPFLNQRLAHAKAMALDRRAAVDAHADLRKTRDLARQLLRLVAGAAAGGCR